MGEDRRKQKILGIIVLGELIFRVGRPLVESSGGARIVGRCDRS